MDILYLKRTTLSEFLIQEIPQREENNINLVHVCQRPRHLFHALPGKILYSW
jgi:hypothetical protein